LNIPARESVTCISEVLKTRGMKAAAGIELSQKSVHNHSRRWQTIVAGAATASFFLDFLRA
jgi:nucleoid-associated protein YejK